jgi:seryl-tRNA synthetase
MLDRRLLREDPDLVRRKLALRGIHLDFGPIVEQEEQRRALLTQIEALKADRNRASDEIGRAKREGQDAESAIIAMRVVGDKIKGLEEQMGELDRTLDQFLLTVPNLPHDSVTPGKSSDENPIVKEWGAQPTFGFKPKEHDELGTKLGILDLERAAKITGARFAVYRGLGAKLERALINFMLETHTAAGYEEIGTPYLVHERSLIGTGQLPKFKEDLFKIEGSEYYLIPTAEVPVTNYHRDEILEGDKLTKKYCAYTPCFRSEAGSAGKDTRGIIRQHQFDKVELVKFAKPEDSYAELEKLTHDAERILQLLEIPYRVVALCGGDLGFSSAKTYDIEVWLPGQGLYREISSCSNFEEFQARRAGIRFKRDRNAKTEFVHTLNGSGLAVGRTLVAILENYQNEKGQIVIPHALRDYVKADLITG